MDEKVVKELLDELFSALEGLDAQSGAMTRLVKAKGLASDEEIA